MTNFENLTPEKIAKMINYIENESFCNYCPAFDICSTGNYKKETEILTCEKTILIWLNSETKEGNKK